MFISPEQARKLKTLAQRVKAACTEPYTADLHFIPYRDGSFGSLSITARSSAVYARLLRMAKRILPEAKTPMEYGYGWNSHDRTPYHHSLINFIVR